MENEKKTIDTAINIDGSGAVRGAEQIEQALNKATNALDKTALASEKAEKATRKLGTAEEEMARAETQKTEGYNRQLRRIEALERKYLGADYATQKYAKAQEYLASIAERAGSHQERAAGVLARLQQEYDKSGNAIQAMAQKQTAAFEALRNTLDPVYVANTKLAESTNVLKTAFEQGKIPVEEYGRLMALATERYGQHGTAAESLTRHMGGMRGAMQQVGYQVADVATQVSMGQNAIQAFAVQGGQLIGAFGPMGAVIGAAITVVGGLAAAFYNVSDATEKAKKAADSYGEAMDRLRKLSQTSIENRRDEALKKLMEEKKFVQDNIEEYKKLIEIEKKRIDIIDAQKESVKFDEISLGYESGPILQRDLSAQAIADYEAKIKDLENNLSVTTTDFQAAKAIREMNDLRATEIKLMSMSGIEREKQRAALDAERQVRERLADAGADPAVVEEQVRLARAHAEKMTELGQATKVAAAAGDQWGKVMAATTEMQIRHTELLTKTNTSVDQQIAAIREEAFQLGLTERERAIRIAQLETENLYKAANLPIDDERIAQIKEEAARLYDLRQAQNATMESARRAIAERERQMESLRRQHEAMVDNVVKYGADRLTDGLMSRTNGGWKKMLQGMFTDLQAFLVRAGAEAALRPIALRMFGVGGGMMGGLMGMSGAASAGGLGSAASMAGYAGATSGGGVGISNIGGLGSLLSGGGSTMLRDVGNWIGTSSFGQSIGLSSVSYGSVDGAGLALSGAGEALSAGLQYSPYGAIGGIAANLMGLGSKNPWISGGMSLAGSIAGGAAGASIGTILGMAGGPVGAVLGAFLGTALSGLFGGGGAKADGADTFLSASGGRPVITGSSAYRGGNVGQTDAMAQAYIDAIDKVAQLTGGQVTGLPIYSFGSVQKYGEFYANGVGKYGSGDEAVKAALEATLRNPNLWSGLTSDIAAAMRNSVGSLEQLGKDIDFAMTYRDSLLKISGVMDDVTEAAKKKALEMTASYKEMAARVSNLGLDMAATNQSFESGLRIMLGLKDAKPAMSEMEKAVASIKATFDSFKPLMTQFGITASEAAMGLQKQLTNVRLGFDKGIADQILAVENPYEIAVRDLGVWANALRSDAKIVGGDMIGVEKLIQIKRAQVAEQYGQSLIDGEIRLGRERAKSFADSFQNWLDGQALGENSTLTGIQKMSMAQGLFDTTLAQAKTGDQAAIGKVTNVADSLLSAARAVYASSPQYAAIETMVRTQVKSLGRVLALPGFATGTPSAPPGLAWVGEKGPELVNFKGGEVVYNAGQSARIAASQTEASRADLRAVARIMSESVAELRSLRQLTQDLVEDNNSLNRRLDMLLSKPTSRTA